MLQRSRLLRLQALREKQLTGRLILALVVLAVLVVAGMGVTFALERLASGTTRARDLSQILTNESLAAA